jgi:TolB-like protein
MPIATVRFDPHAVGFHERRQAAPLSAANAEVMVPDGENARPMPASKGFPRAAVEETLARILASHTFRQSERHRAFIRYVVEATLDGRSRCLKEVVIGLDVFARDLDGYDPRRDSIVRVEARRLRKKLRRYYDTEGDRDPIEIRLEAGSYVPVFVARLLDRRTNTTAPLILVLPFRMIGDADSSRAMAVGLGDQMIDRLGSQSGLKVLAPLAAMRLAEKQIEIDVLRRQHGIDYVVDGSITRYGAKLRCAAHLSRTRDRLRLWSGGFDFDPSATTGDVDNDLFSFQDRISEALFDAVKAERGSNR